MYNVGNTVIYGTTGVCKVVEIVQRKFKDKNVTYYVLSPIYQSNSKVFVPTDNESLVSRMKAVLSADEIYQLINEMPDEDIVWNSNEKERNIAYAQILKAGDRKGIVNMIRALYKHEKSQLAMGRKFHSADERFLHDAEALLYGEIAHVLQIKEEEVLPLIISTLGEDDGEVK